MSAGSKVRTKPIIAFDGPAGSGKTSTAREVAKRLGFRYIDTGAMYRTIALNVLRHGCDVDDAASIAKIAKSTSLSIKFIEDQQRIFLGEEDVTEEIRSPEVTQAVTPVCEVSDVRKRMVAIQREMGSNGGVVIEGRDIGTVVFPDAELKIFMTADIEERARRRVSDFENSGVPMDLSRVIADIAERDRRDSSRDDSPLRKAYDAVVIDTTGMSFEEQVDHIIDLVKKLPEKTN